MAARQRPPLKLPLLSQVEKIRVTCRVTSTFRFWEQLQAVPSYSPKKPLEVYSISDEKKVKLIYEVKGLYTHKIFGGHFIGAIVEKNGEHLQVPMKYIHNYNYNYALKKDSELNFYYWEENNKLKLTIKEEPVDIMSSEDLQFMIICFKDKYNVYKLNEYTGNLEKINTVYDTVVNGYIYENIIFIYLTEYGTYFLILNKESPFPCKLFRQSDSVNLYNLKIARKFKENVIIST